MIAPNSTIKILKCPIELDNENQLTFSTKQAQYNYFNSLTKIELEEATFQRKDNVLRFPTNETTLTFDDLIEYNYCMYQNTNYGDKWFYAFITNISYENDGLSLITLETDVFQTWQLDIEYKKCFVEREHIAKVDDIAGANTIPENLELGEYIINSTNKNVRLTFRGFLVGATIDLKNKSGNKYPNINGLTYGGVYSGVKYFYYALASQISDILKDVADCGQSDGILAIYAVPTSLISTTDGVVDSSLTAEIINWASQYDTLPTKPSTIDSYTPVNNKLLTFPYTYMLASNNVGGNAIYKYERFSQIDFDIYSTIVPSMSIMLVPKNYNGETNNYEEALVSGKFPVCSWNSDVYTNWITQNGLNIGLNVAGATIGGIASIVTGNPIGVASSALSIANTLGQIYEHSLIPPHNEGNINSGDVTFASGNLTFTLYQMSIKDEYAQIIDNYFTMYGYKTNRLKLPNLTNRSNFNYVKTIGCNIVGDIPQTDLQKIKDMFNNGVTLWHNSTTFLNYDVANN